MVNAHVAEKPGRQQKRGVLHRTLATLSRETKLGWVGQQVTTEVTVLLLFNNKGIFV
jgi:hypothetical protein